MSTIIALVRHGETDWNALGRFQGSSDTPLNELGRQQAASGVSYLRDYATKHGFTWDLLRFSPLQRAGLTGQILADALEISERRTQCALAERDWGGAEGRTIDEIYAAYPFLPNEELIMRDSIPGAEPRELVTARGLFAMSSLASQYPGKHIIAASHGTLLRCALIGATGRDVGPIPNVGTIIVNVCLDDGLTVEILEKNFD